MSDKSFQRLQTAATMTAQEETSIRQLIVSNQNRWSRVTLDFKDLTQILGAS